MEAESESGNEKGHAMDILQEQEWKSLATEEGHCVSIYLPTSPGTPEGFRDHLLLKSGLQRAAEMLAQRGMTSADIRRMLDPAALLVEDEGFWHDRSQGLALLISRRIFGRWRLPLAFQEFVHVGRTFQLRPLLPLLVEDQPYYLLAFSQNRIRLFRGSRFSFEAVPEAMLPPSLRAIAATVMQADGGVQFHTGGARHPGQATTSVYHGQGGRRDDQATQMTLYLKGIREAMRPVLRGSTLPLVLATVPENAAAFREVNEYPHLRDESVAGNPDYLTPRELHERSWPMVQRVVEAKIREATRAFHELSGSDRVSTDERSVIVAAAQGRVASLFVERDSHLWGSLEPTTQAVQFLNSDSPGAEDLLDRAAVLTHEQRGAVYVVPRHAIPANASVAAIYRY